MATHKHLNQADRYQIETLLKDSFSFKSIGKELGKDCTTISKEIRSHIIFKKSGAYGRCFNDCQQRMSCSLLGVCADCSNPRRSSCKFCDKCTRFCSLFKKEHCQTLLKPPYVCNGCSHRHSCTLEKSLYSAAYAQKEYEMCRSEARSGITICEEEALRLDALISPLIRKGQSIHHICVNHHDSIMHSEKTIYNYVGYNLFSARNLDLPRKVRYRPRKRTARFKVDKACRIGRTYSDFLVWVAAHPDTPIVEMDTVEGVKGGKVLLTIHFIDSLLMLAFLRESNTSQSVLNIFDTLYLELGSALFQDLFPIILTDNGSEFSNPSAIEFDQNGNRRTRIFYCDPSAPYQKGAVENNHEFIRRITPKGTSFNILDQKDVSLMMDQINSYSRKKLNDHTPYDTFRFLHGSDVLKKLGANALLANEITLNPSLFKA